MLSSRTSAGTVTLCNCEPRQMQSKLDRYLRSMFDRGRETMSTLGGSKNDLLRRRADKCRTFKHCQHFYRHHMACYWLNCQKILSLWKMNSHYHHREHAHSHTDLLQDGRNDGGSRRPH